MVRDTSFTINNYLRERNQKADVRSDLQPKSLEGNT